jgi:hypothetical protein
VVELVVVAEVGLAIDQLVEEGSPGLRFGSVVLIEQCSDAQNAGFCPGM